MWQSSPIMATMALVVGIVLWIIFIRWVYVQYLAQPKRQQQNIQYLTDNGRLTRGTVVGNSPVNINKDGSHQIEMTVEFTNLSNTVVRYTFAFTDTKPHEKRYDIGKTINLRLSMDSQSSGFIIEGMEGRVSFGFGFFAIAFVVLYMVITFLVHYALFSNGHGWRFLSLWHPWIMTPVMGLLLFNTSGLIGRLFGGRHGEEEDLVLYGKKTTAVVQHAEQTGTYINEQPQIKYILQYNDDKGKQHLVTLKKIVPLTQLHDVNTGTQDILYLPEDPEKIMFV